MEQPLVSRGCRERLPSIQQHTFGVDAGDAAHRMGLSRTTHAGPQARWLKSVDNVVGFSVGLSTCIARCCVRWVRFLEVSSLTLAWTHSLGQTALYYRGAFIDFAEMSLHQVTKPTQQSAAGVEDDAAHEARCNVNFH